jgi:spoIIIJ-associated protein
MSQDDRLDHLFTLLTFPHASVAVDDRDDGVKIDVAVDPSESGVLIGYHGEVIDALQLVVSLMFNNQSADDYKPVEVDINGYRATREKNLQDLASKAAENAISSGREIILPPLNSRERRLIHVFLSTREDVTTYSEGEGSARRLVVRPQHV